MSRQSFEVSDDREVSVDAKPSAPRRPWYQSRWFRVAFGGCMLLVGLCKGLVLLTGATNYGMVLEVNHADLYYTAAVSKEEAQALGAYLVEAKVFDGSHISVQLTREGQMTQVRFPLKPGANVDEAFIASARELASQISQNVFHGAPVEIDLCNEQMKTLRALLPSAA